MAALQGVSVYPNPAAGANYTLSNYIGQVLLQGRIHTAKEGINMSALPAGSYLLQLRDTEGRRGVI